AYFCLGNTLCAQGRFADAREPLRRAQALWSKDPSRRQEATEQAEQCEYLNVLDRKLPGVLKGDAKPGSVAEHLFLALVCGWKARYAAAARLYAEVFAAHPRSGDVADGYVRYNAACCAARASASEGEGTKSLPDKVLLMFRRQALHWLQGNLSLYATGFAHGATKEAMREQLARWL